MFHLVSAFSKKGEPWWNCSDFNALIEFKNIGSIGNLVVDQGSKYSTREEGNKNSKNPPISFRPLRTLASNVPIKRLFRCTRKLSPQYHLEKPFLAALGLIRLGFTWKYLIQIFFACILKNYRGYYDICWNTSIRLTKQSVNLSVSFLF